MKVIIIFLIIVLTLMTFISASSTGRFLKDIGALTYFEHAYTRVQIYSLKFFR